MTTNEEYLNLVNSENFDGKFMLKIPELLRFLLISWNTTTKTKDHNIIWATDNYEEFGKGYKTMDEISASIIESHEDLVIPRSQKDKETQKARTKGKAEVFTPLWVVKKQVEAMIDLMEKDDLESFVDATWLEITCGEGPYIVSRYDMYSGEQLPLESREGYLDRKLRRVSEAVDDHADWLAMVTRAYKASYGYEWQGDSLFLARQNLILTFMDYHLAKFGALPSLEEVLNIAEIVSYNLFQMDGLKFIVPMTEKEVEVRSGGLNFGEVNPVMKKKLVPGKPSKLMDWKTGKLGTFKKMVMNKD